jgi:type II secretory pathway pseudopilin PulG
MSQPTAPAPLSAAAPAAAGERGYTMVALVMVLAVMSIMMGVAVQAVDFQMRREREAELIFRGQQYVEAIRIFRAKYGRSPLRLKELWDAKPRVIRKKWKDPMTGSVSWGLVFEGDEIQGRGGRLPGGGTGPVATGTPSSDRRGGFGRGAGDDPDDGDADRGPLPMGTPVIPVSGDGESKEPTRIGPIIGVQTPKCGESIKIFEGRSDYCEWKFVYRERQNVGGGGIVPRPPGPRRTPRGGGGSGGGGGDDDQLMITPTAPR